jgi:hypothetical protein
MNEPTCAVWYYRHHVVYYEVCDDETKAVSYASYLNEHDEGAVAGVQFADGRFVERDGWTALDEYEREQTERWRAAAKAEAQNPTPPRGRDVRLPWDTSDTAYVEAGDPAWLGVRAESHSER